MRFGFGFGIDVSGAPFSPLALFAAGEQGIWLDPSDFSTMFQDSAGTTPVTAVGQPVGLIRDKSGRANHVSQSTAASRPVLAQDSTGRYYLQPDGVDDYMLSPSINSGTNKLTVWAGYRKASDAARAIICELSTDIVTNNGSFRIAAPNANAATNVTFSSKGTTAQTAASTAYAAPITVVETGIGDISGDVAQMRVNGAVINTNTADQGTGNYGNYPIYIGGRVSSFFFSGRIYGIIVRFAQSTAAQVAQTENYMNGKTGAY